MTAPAIPIPDTTADKPPRPRRWIPLSLWIFVAMLGILAAIGSWKSVRIYQERSAIGEIESLGGHVSTFRGYGDTDGLLAWIGDQLDVLPGQVWRVDLNYSATTDVTLEQLKCFSELNSLWLNGTAVTDAGLVHAANLKNLSGLWLGETHVTDAGLQQLKRLPDLAVLVLNYTQVSDAGLKHLKGVPNLRMLYVMRTRVTDAGIADLQRALPDLKIEK